MASMSDYFFFVQTVSGLPLSLRLDVAERQVLNLNLFKYNIVQGRSHQSLLS